MDIVEAGTIIRSGDGYMIKKFIEKNAGSDKQMAASIVRTLNNEIAKARLMAWALVILGLMSLIFIIGIPLLIGGIVWHVRVNKWKNVLEDGRRQWAAENESSATSLA